MARLRFDGRVAIQAATPASAGRMPCCWRRGARRSWSTTSQRRRPSSRKSWRRAARPWLTRDSVATEEGAAAIVQTALDAFGGVDIVVNNAAIAVNAAFDVLQPRDFRRTFAVNLLGPVLSRTQPGRA